MKHLFKALAAFQQEVPVIHKGAKGYGYSYADLPAIFEQINPILKKHGLGFYQALNESALKTVVFHVESGETIESNSVIPSDVQLKGMNDFQVIGSAVTYFRRYALSSLLGLVTDKDMDASGEQTKKQKYVNSFNKAVEKNLSEKPTRSGVTRSGVTRSGVTRSGVTESPNDGYSGKPTQKKATDKQLKTINMILMQDLMKHDPLQQADFSNVNIKRAGECIEHYNEVIELRKFIRDNLPHQVFDAQEKETIGNEYLSASKDVLKGIVDEMVYKIEKYDHPATRTANH